MYLSFVEIQVKTWHTLGIMRFTQSQQLHTSCSCSWPECCERGEYPAPRKPGNTREYLLFCLVHIRAYNRKWNYFAHMSADQAEAFACDSLTGHRPTSKRHQYRYIFRTLDILEEALHHMGVEASAEKKEKEAIPRSELEALRVLELSYPITWEVIRQRYKMLAKTCHPDIHGREGEERFKAINQAYQHLKTIYA